MNYALVEFTKTKTVAVVPTIWILHNKCWWPTHVSAERLVFMVKKSRPRESTWEKFKISVIGLFATYDHARKNLDKSQYTSDLSSGPDRGRKRHRRAPLVYTDSEESESEHSQHASKKLHAPVVPEDFPQGLASVGEASSDPQRDHDRSVTSEASASSSSPAHASTHQAFEDAVNTVSDFEQNTTRLLNILRYMLQQQGEVLNTIVKTLSSLSVAPCAAPVIEQPFSSLEELLAFDEKLDKEASNTLVNEFVQLGGSDGNWATKRILAYCMTDEVAAQFSWMGRKGKRSFSALKIAKVVKVAASKAPNSTPVIIEAAVKSWLRHAPERLVPKPRKQRSGSEVRQTADSE